MQTETTTYILPSYVASALINNDYSGLDKSDRKALNEWILQEQPGNCVGCSEEEYFKWSNDMSNLGGNVLEFYFS